MGKLTINGHFQYVSLAEGMIDKISGDAHSTIL